MENTDKIVNGVTYERVPITVLHGQISCVGCAHKTNPDRGLCGSLTTADCAKEYVWQVKDVTKSSVQGVKTDTGKPRYTLIPPFALEQVAICLTEGLKTHPAKDNWKLVEKGKERFLDSLYRHWNQYQMGEIFDRDNPNVRNLAAIIVNALFVLEFETNPELKGNK